MKVQRFSPRLRVSRLEAPAFGCVRQIYSMAFEVIVPIFSKKNSFDIAFSALTATAALTVIVVLCGIVTVLVKESWPAIQKFGFLRFLFTVEWNPVTSVFGAASAVYGTLVTTTIALIIAIPTAVGIAIFVTEIAPNSLKGVIGGAIELLAAIPSIIYGMWGLFTLAPIMTKYIEPFLQRSLGNLPIFKTLLAGTPMGIDLLTASVILRS